MNPKLYAKPEPEPEPQATQCTPSPAHLVPPRTFVSWARPGYLLCRLPEVSRVGEPAVQLGQLLQHVGQLSEGGPVPQVVRPAGREDFLRAQAEAVSETLWPLSPRLCLFISETRQLTVTSLPRLISARTFLMPSPLPTCQMVASTGWLVIGQSLAWSSYQIVL